MLCLFILFGSDAGADFYRYTDVDGVVRYTDDKTKIPAQYDNRVKSYQTADETESSRSSRAADETESSREPVGKTAQTNSNIVQQSKNSVPPDNRLRNSSHDYDQLYLEGKLLKKQFADLVREKEALEKEEPRLSPAEYNDRVISLNLKIQDYEKHRQAFQALADAYNAGLKTSPQKSP